MASPAVPLTLTAVSTSLGRTHPRTLSPSMTTRTPVFCIKARASSTCISGSTFISESMVAEATCRDEAGIPRDFLAPSTRAICLVVMTPPSLSLLVTRSLLRSFFSIRSRAWPSRSDLSIFTGSLMMSLTCIYFHLPISAMISSAEK